MALTLGDNFSYQGAKPLDARLKYETVAAMKAVADATMYDGCLAYCAGTDKTYQWKSGNTVDETTGKWREFTSGGGGGGGTSYTAGDGIDITNDVISTEKSASGDIDKIIDRYPTAGALVSIVNAFNKGDLYSADEKMIGQWIDGKPLYQKTFEFTPSTYSSGSEYHIPSSVTGLTNYVPVGFELWDVWSECINNGIVSVRTSDYVLILKNATIPYPSIKHHMTLRYTKATDQAVSIGEANDYSTSEKIIGTWIDGKPLYQKTIAMNSLTLDGETKVAHNIANVEFIANAFGVAFTTAGQSIPIPFYNKVTNYNIFVIADKTYVSVYNYGLSDRKGYVTLQYTKTSS